MRMQGIDFTSCSLNVKEYIPVSGVPAVPKRITSLHLSVSQMGMTYRLQDNRATYIELTMDSIEH